MRVLFLSSLYPPDVTGGAELTLERIADGLAGRGHAVGVLTTGRTRADEVRPSGVRVMRRRIPNVFPIVPARRRSAWIRALWHVLDCINPGGQALASGAIRDFKPDAVVADTLGGLSVAVWRAARAAGIPIIQRLCDAYLLSPSLNTLFAPPGSPQALFRWFVRWPHRPLSRQVSAVVALSAAILDLHRNRGLFVGTPAEIIPTAIAPQIRQMKPQAGPLGLGFIGQLVPTKGIDVLLEGFRLADIDATLTIAGTGPEDYVAALKARYADPRVRFLGWVSDKRAFFSDIDLCVVPSRIYDTLPTVIIESFAHHVPVLASPIGGIPEMIETGRNGTLADLGTPGQVAAALRATAADAAAIRAMADSTAEASARFLDPATQLDRWEAVIRRVTAGERP